MFGELGDLDICGANRGGNFDEPSEETNYSFDDQNYSGESISDDYIDTFDSGAANEKTAPASSKVAEDTVTVENNTVQQSSQEQKTQKSGGLFFVVLVLLLISAVGLFFYKRNAEQTVDSGNAQEMGDYFYDKATENAPTDVSASQNQESMATVDVELASAEQTVEQSQPEQPKDNKIAKNKTEKTPADNSKAKAEKKAFNSVVIPVTSGGRVDPFYPYNEAVAQKAITSSKPAFDIIAPPLVLPEQDPVIDRLLEVRIAGIMYDEVRPSAIITIDGVEQLVHKGDVVTDFKVLNITKTKVILKYNANVYEVSTGQVLKPEGVNFNPVSSVTKQFGGAYTSTPKNILQFN